jgi:hypothetical protein
MAWEYIAGSIFFLTGGIFNFYRSYVANNHYRRLEARKIVYGEEESN